VDIYPCTKFHCNSFMGSLPPNMWNITPLWLFCCPVLSWPALVIRFFSGSRPGRSPGRILTACGLNDVLSPKDVPFGGFNDGAQFWAVQTRDVRTPTQRDGIISTAAGKTAYESIQPKIRIGRWCGWCLYGEQISCRRWSGHSGAKSSIDGNAICPLEKRTLDAKKLSLMS